MRGKKIDVFATHADRRLGHRTVVTQGRRTQHSATDISTESDYLQDNQDI